MWILRSAADPEGGGLTFRLSTGTTRTIGRTPHADFALDRAMVSRLHCRLSVSAAGDCEVVDLDSTNGTYVNGRRVRQAVLAPGDRLRIGRVELTVEKAERTR